MSELGEALNIAPSTISHHIKELRRAQLIRTERDGQFIRCWIDPDTLRHLASFFSPNCLPGSDRQITDDDRLTC